MSNPRVLFLGHDLFDLGYVVKYPEISESKSFQNDKLITNEYSIEVDNRDNQFTSNNPKSILNAVNWLYQRIIVYDENNELVWDGIVTNIIRNHQTRTAEIKSLNSLYLYTKNIVSYQSADWETLADAFKNICDENGYENYNLKSVNDSITQLEVAQCYVKVNVVREDNMTFFQLLEKLGEYANADVYTKNNQTYFEHWYPRIGNAVAFINENDLIDFPIVWEDETEIINDYSISYDGDLGIQATDENSNNIGMISRSRYGTMALPEMASGTDGQIIFKDKASAIYIGESYIERTTKNYLNNPVPLTKLSFSISINYKTKIDMSSRFRFTFNDEDYDDKLFEVFEITIDNDTSKIIIIAYEVEE